MGSKHTNIINTYYLQLEINYFNKLLSLKNSQLLEHFAIVCITLYFLSFSEKL